MRTVTIGLLNLSRWDLLVNVPFYCPVGGLGIRKKISRQFYIPPHLYANNGLLGLKNSRSRAPSFDQFQINLWVFILSIQLMAVKVKCCHNDYKCRSTWNCYWCQIFWRCSKKNQCSFIIFFKNLKFCIIRVFTLLFFCYLRSIAWIL